jgi:hypothetical protein
MLNEGSITADKARQLLRAQGVQPDMIDSFMFDSSSTKVQKAKELTESTVSTLYQEEAINEAQAREFLVQLRYESHEIDFVLMAWQMARQLKYRNSAIATVHSQYTAHKIDKARASVLLDGFHVPPAQRDALIALWTQEATTKVTLLTPAQIKTAWKKDFLTDDEALSRLINLGYSSGDAEIFLAI